MISELNYTHLLQLEDILGDELLHRIININSSYKQLKLSPVQQGEIERLFIKINVFRKGPSIRSNEIFKDEIHEMVDHILSQSASYIA